MKFLEFLNTYPVYLDGGMGTLLQERGLLPGEAPERWNLSRPEDIQRIHRDYFEAGSNVVNTNTFGANLLHFSKEELERIIPAAVENAKIARDIRNEENRATNCVTRNIGKTVNASRRVCLAVEEIRAQGKFETMPAELRETARLRTEHPEANLVELAAMHSPPITKSGVNHRLRRLSKLAGK